MAFLRLFKSVKNQQFSYKPRFWDPKKEEAEKIKQRVEQIQNGGVDAVKTRISGGFRKGAGGEAAGAYRSARVKKSNSTLLIVLISLVGLAYVVYKMYFPELEAWLS